MLEIGTKAPGFTLQDQDGNQVSLDDFLGRPVVLFFYPKDNTPGCSTHAAGFGGLFPEFEAAGAVVLGISKDSVASHKKFHDKLQLPYRLLSDPDHSVLEAYGAWQLMKRYGREYMGTKRSGVLIDEKGYVAFAEGNAKPADNPPQMLEALSSLKN